MRRIIVTAAAGLTLALGAAGAAAAHHADNPTPPTDFFQKSYRLDVNLQDVSGTVFDATLSDIPSSVPQAAQDYLNWTLGPTTFDLQVPGATCFLVPANAAAHTVPCSQIGDMVDNAVDGVDATVLATPLNGNPLALAAKKVTVWTDAGGNDVRPPADNGTSGTDNTTANPPPATFYTKNIRLDVNLEDVTGLVFDGTVNDVPSSVPKPIHDYLDTVLDGSTFEIDASAAKCFFVKNGVATKGDCSALATQLDDTADDGIDVTILAKAVPGPTLAYKAKKITVQE